MGILEMVLGLFSFIDGIFGGNRWVLAWFVAVLNMAYVMVTVLVMPAAVSEQHDSLKEELKLIQRFNSKTGLGIKDISPVSDSLVVFYLYKGLALLLDQIQAKTGDPQQPQLTLTSEYRILYHLILNGIAISLQCLLMFLPMISIIEASYKKNSSLFKTLMSLMCLTTTIFYGHLEGRLQFQAILFAGFTLWS